EHGTSTILRQRCTCTLLYSNRFDRHALGVCHAIPSLYCVQLITPPVWRGCCAQLIGPASLAGEVALRNSRKAISPFPNSESWGRNRRTKYPPGGSTPQRAGQRSK